MKKVELITSSIKDSFAINSNIILIDYWFADKIEKKDLKIKNDC